MMLVSEWVEVGLKGNRRIPYYRDKGYEIPMMIGKKGKPVIDYSKTILVYINDMPQYSESKVLITCDYNEEGCRGTYEKNSGDYIKNNINSVVHKDCCSNRKCQVKKTAECNLINYGFEYHVNQEDFMKNTQKTNVERYGSPYVMGTDYFKQKTLEVLNNKYGVDNISQLEEVKIKKAETFYKNGSVKTSRQQEYLWRLLGGELNYANNTPSLDIAFPEQKVYIEFNGKGHDLCVKTKQMTQKEFDNRERRRYHYLKNLGWKGIFINSEQDYLPNDEVIINEINKALEWFKSNEKGHWHYNIYIGNKINDITYGKLRKITEKDLIREVS
jgi:hypothetical protein